MSSVVEMFEMSEESPELCLGFSLYDVFEWPWKEVCQAAHGKNFELAITSEKLGGLETQESSGRHVVI